MKERLDRMGRKTGENEKRAELKRLFGTETSVERFLADYR
jgi:hypothetical protein